MANTTELQTHVADYLQMRLDADTFVLQYANRQFEGVLKAKGDTIKVEDLPIESWVALPADTITDMTLTDATATAYSIQVAQSAGVAKHVPDIEQIRTAFDLKGGILDTIYAGLKQAHETHFLAQMVTDAGNTVATAALATTTIVAKIFEMAQLLDDDNAPQAGRILVVTPEVASALLQSGIYVYTDWGMDDIRTGQAPDVAGFKVYKSTLLPTKTIIGFVAGIPHFVNQLSTIEINKRELRAGYALIGETYYQSKTVGALTNCICKHVYT